MSSDLEILAPADDARPLVLAFLATKRSVNTRQAYLRDLAEFARWCDGHGTALLTADEITAAVFARHLESIGRKNTTIARKMAAVSSFYAWCLRHGHAQANPVATLDRPQVDYDTSATAGLTKDQAVALMHAADRETERTAALVAVLLFTGARVSEVLSADIEDLGTDRGHRVLKVRRKGGKVQSLVLPAPAVARVDAYLASRDDYITVPMTRDDPTRPPRRVLFATGTGNRMYRAEVRRLLHRLGKAAGLPDDLTDTMCPHSMRHAYATLSLDANVSLRDVQDAMGHADPRTTRRYDRSRGNLDRAPGLTLAGYVGLRRLPSALSAPDPL
jgi:integrase/recombinase XerD